MTWQPVVTLPVGGLTDVGFVGHLLLVASHQGRGVVDCHSGAIVAREADEDYYALNGGLISGIGPLDGYAVVLAGLYSNRVLPLSTRDGWSARVDHEGATLNGPDGQTVRVPDHEALRAVGFSPDGRFFVLATSPSLTLLRRTPLAADPDGREVVAFDDLPVPAVPGPTIPTTRVAVTAVRGSRWVLVHHRGSGRWGLPGGQPVGEESWRTTAGREFAAQTAMQCGSLRFVGRATVRDGGDGHLEHIPVFRTWAIEGLPFAPTEDVDERRWWDGASALVDPVDGVDDWIAREALRRG